MTRIDRSRRAPVPADPVVRLCCEHCAGGGARRLGDDASPYDVEWWPGGGPWAYGGDRSPYDSECWPGGTDRSPYPPISIELTRMIVGLALTAFGHRSAEPGGRGRGRRGGTEPRVARRPVLLGAVVCLLGMLGAMVVARLVYEYALPMVPLVGGLLVVVAVWRAGADRRG